MPRFPLFGIPVTIRPSFLIIAALIGFTGRRDPAFVIAWVAIVFLSILIHELGHAFTARGFGAEVAIELNGLGGLTRWGVRGPELGPGRRALIAAAGSGVGVLFGGLVWIAREQFGPFDGLTASVIELLIFVNVFWGLLNWLPIRPLDGGHLLRSLLEKLAPERGDVIARVVFTVTAAGALLFALNSGLLLIALLAGWLLLSEFTIGLPSRPAAPIPPFSYDDPAEPVESDQEDPDH